MTGDIIAGSRRTGNAVVAVYVLFPRRSNLRPPLTVTASTLAVAGHKRCQVMRATWIISPKGFRYLVFNPPTSAWPELFIFYSS
jgi:hypothetical protein